MSRKNRIPLIDRVFNAAEEALATQHYVAPIDVMVRIGWLPHTVEAAWRQGRIDTLMEVVQADPARIAEALGLLRTWATRTGLIASETRYVARAVDHHELRFTPDGNPAVEQVFRTHWVSPALPEKKRERLTEKQSRPPELGGRDAPQGHLEMPPLRRHGRSAGDGKSRPGLPELRRPG